MKKILFLGLIFTSLATATTACSDKKSGTETTTTTSPATATDSTAAASGGNPESGVAAATYTCTMHPEVITNEPGKCPKCGMDLVKK